MRSVVLGFGLFACVALAGCFQAEQHQAREHEDFLKKTLGIAGQVGDPPMQAHAQAGEVPGHAAAAD